MSASDKIRVGVWVYKLGDVDESALGVRILPDATVDDIVIEVARIFNVTPTKVLLWKPHQFLSSTAIGHGDLIERLKKYDNDFRKFCDDLFEAEMVSNTVLQLFSLDSSCARHSKNTALIATVIPPKEKLVTNREGLEEKEQGHAAELWKNYKVTATKKNPLSPSLSAKPENYCQHQNGPSPILDGRYCEEPREIPAPIEIYHPVFAEFIANINDETLAVTQDVVKDTVELMAAASKIATHERERVDTRVLLQRVLDYSITQNVNLNRTSADHIITHVRELRPHGHAALAIVEEKGELGQSGEGSIQGSFSYLQYWTEPSLADLNELSFCPSFIISIAGPWIVICGAILTTHAVVQRLTDYLWLGHSRILDDSRTLALARVFHSLSIAIQRLSSYYDDLSPTPHNADVRFYPLANSYPAADGQIIKFRYLEPLKGADPSCVAFLARHEGDGHENRRIVVKFAERYGADVHRILANRNLSPKLFYCGDVWSEMPAKRGCGSRKMVVMEYLKWQTAADKYADGKVPQVVCDAVQEGLKALHDRKMVHGDIRLPNILVRDDGDGARTQVKIIDFDWAGTEGEVRYPLRLSQDIRWAPGVSDHELIKAEHDDWMVNHWS